MKKLFSLLAVLLVASVSFAQQQNDPTIASSTVTFAMCTPTASSVTINAQSFPVVWQGESFNQAGTYNRVIENVKGCDSTVTLTIKLDDGSLPGVFSIGSGANDKIVFSKGVLQYRPRDTNGELHHAVQGDPAGTESGTGIFRFAENQYDICQVPGHYGNVENGNNHATDARGTMTTWIDLFGRGTSGVTVSYNTYNPVGSTGSDKYANVNFSEESNKMYDWGYYNAISNGGNTPGMWFTPTNAQMTYLLTQRDGANSKKMPVLIADIPVKDEGMTGMVIFPDNWTSYPTGWDLSQIEVNNERYVITLDQFKELEAQGAILVYLGYYRIMSSQSYDYASETYGYWLSDCAPNGANTNAKMYTLKSNGYILLTTGNTTGNGLYVRLVKYANQ